MKRAFFLLILTPALFAAERKAITHEELVRRTQELADAVAAGNQTPWNADYADDAIYFDEKGRRLEKKVLLSEITPLPPGYLGAIKVENARSRFYGDTAIFDYDLDESLTIHGQRLNNARFHGTDTWVRRKGRWQIVATQMLRYYADPAEDAIDSSSLDRYTGTYELAPGVTMTVTREGDALYSQRVASGRRSGCLLSLRVYSSEGASKAGDCFATECSSIAATIRTSSGERRRHRPRSRSPVRHSGMANAFPIRPF